MIIFATSTAGPARYLAPVIKAVGKGFVCVSSSVSAGVFDEYDIRSEIIDLDTQEAYDSFVENKFKNMGIEFIVTGTSWGNCVDKAFIGFGRRHGLKVASIIEHWSFYRERFVLGDELILPDYIVVNDAYAKSGAVKAGLPENAIYVLGNPALENKKKEGLRAMSKKEWLKALKMPDKKIVAFISESYAKDFPVGRDHYQGFDEYRVVEDILSIVDAGELLLIKTHPSENRNKYDVYKGVTVTSDTDVHSLVTNADFVVGMGSMLLIEASLVRRDVISYRPGGKTGFIGNDLGITRLVTDKAGLRDIFDGKVKLHNSDFRHEFNGSTRRVAQFIEERA